DDASGPTSLAAPCKISSDWLMPYKQCDVDDDCQVGAYRTNCCVNQIVVGIAKNDGDTVQACADQAPPVCPNSGGCSTAPDRAEDGRAVGDLNDVEVHCVDNVCRSQVAMRACGPMLTCQIDEVCTIYENVPGSMSATPGQNAVYTYQCDKNPCPSERLDCSCAQSLCDAKTDALRMCTIEFASESDVYCKRQVE
ncbi:MAG TPA: hypothetical protein VGI70_15180, partial [Polyangiales bacterium]